MVVVSNDIVCICPKLIFFNINNCKTQLTMDDFPYKSLLFEPSQLNVERGLQESTIQVVEQELPTLSLPAGYSWTFKGVDNVACVTQDQAAYQDVNRLTDYFSEAARVRANVKGFVSPYEYWQKNKAFIKKKFPNDVHGQREYLYEKTKEANLFKISATYALLSYLKAHKVLDPSAGWGDRLLGAGFTPTVDVYHAVDPNTALVVPYNNMLKYLNVASTDDFKVISADFLKVTIPDKYDTVFTSPPFFDYEVYSDEQSQSISGRNSLTVWVEEFYTPYLTKAYDALVSGGRMCLYVSDTKSLKGFVAATLDIMNNVLGGDYEGVIAIVNEDLKRPFPLWVWRKP
jgi:hypothetical protein